MKSVIFFNKLDYFSLILSVLLKPFFSSIHFRNAIVSFQKHNVINKLKMIGIYWISFVDSKYGIYNESHKIREELEVSFVNNRVKNNILVKKLINDFNFDQLLEKKLFLSFRQQFFQDDYNSEASSIVLAKNYFLNKDKRVFYFPSDYNSYLLIKEFKSKKFCIIGIHAFINLFFKLTFFAIKKFKNLFSKIFFKKLEKKTIKKNNISYKYQIAYFPHQSLKYGNFFKKTYLYDNDHNSPLFKEKLLTLFWDDTDEISKRYFRIHGIPWFNLQSFKKNKILFIKNLKFFLGSAYKDRLSFFLSINRLFFFIFFIQFTKKFIYSIHVLNQFKYLKLIYVHYDTLFPQTFLLACALKGVKTMSAQERPYHYLLLSPQFYDSYLTAGDGFHKILKNKGYICEQFITVGLPRTTYINKKKTFFSKKIEEYLKIKENKKIILCFGLIGANDFEAGLYGQNGNSLKSQINFANCILKLSKNFNNLHFIVRYKDENTHRKLPTNLLNEINNFENIEINTNFNSVNSYDLISISDFVIGKFSTIMEESLSAGKEIAILDEENYCSSLGHVINEIDVVKSSYEEIYERLKLFSNGNFEKNNKVQSIKENFFPKKDLDIFELIKQTAVEKINKK